MISYSGRRHSAAPTSYRPQATESKLELLLLAKTSFAPVSLSIFGKRVISACQHERLLFVLFIYLFTFFRRLPKLVSPSFIIFEVNIFCWAEFDHLVIVVLERRLRIKFISLSFKSVHTSAPYFSGVVESLNWSLNINLFKTSTLLNREDNKHNLVYPGKNIDCIYRFHFPSMLLRCLFRKNWICKGGSFEGPVKVCSSSIFLS